MDRIAFFIPDLVGGGAEKTVLKLVTGISQRGIAVDLVLVNATGVYLKDVPDAVRIIDLGKKRAFNSLIPLARYLRLHKPGILVSNLSHCNIIAMLAKMNFGIRIPVILVEHLVVTENHLTHLKDRLILMLMKKLYPRANAVVAVSKNTACNIEQQLGLKTGSVVCIYNPVTDKMLLDKSLLPIQDRWFTEKQLPVFLAVGRLVSQKGFDVLINAFILVRNKMPVKLVILGQGPLRDKLQHLIDASGFKADINMPGFIENPFPYMRSADVFVLSSLYEGLGNVLVEAMACGCRVVATDCPSGPSEILEQGKYGILVTPGDAPALADAMTKALQSIQVPGQLEMRADFFSVDKAVSAYLELIEIILADHKRESS